MTRAINRRTQRYFLLLMVGFVVFTFFNPEVLAGFDDPTLVHYIAYGPLDTGLSWCLHILGLGCFSALDGDISLST